MNLNDPFSRLSKKQQNEYLAFRQSMKDASISNLADAEALLKNIHTRMKIFTLVVIAIGLVTILFMPQLKSVAIVFGLLTLLWIFTTTLKGHRYLKRYISEEISAPSE